MMMIHVIIIIIIDYDHGDSDFEGYVGGEEGIAAHTSNLSFLLHGQNFWRIKFTPKNANFSR